MSSYREIIAERNRKIYKRYRELYDKEYLRHERCIELLAKEFHFCESGVYKAVLEEKKKDTALTPQPA